MFAKVNEDEVINVHNVGYIKVLRGEVGTASKPSGYYADFYNGQGKAIARSYEFPKRADCWDFVRQVISDGSRRDMLAFAALDKNQSAA